MTTNLTASANPKIKEIITCLDDDKIGKVYLLPFKIYKNEDFLFWISFIKLAATFGCNISLVKNITFIQNI